MLDGVTNPAAGNPILLTASTTSDTPAVTSGGYAIAPGQRISQPSVSLNSFTPGAVNVTYTVSFTTSSTGGLSGAANSQITITLPAGSSTSTIVGSSVLDTSTGNNQVGDCFAQGGSTTIEICDIFNGSTVNAGDGVKVVLDGVTNPANVSTADTLAASTTSDTPAVTSGPYGAGGPPPPPPPPPPASPPAVSGGTPTTKTSSSAAVAGSVNPEGTPTTAFFQYGLDPSFRGPGASTTLYDQSTPPQPVGSDFASHTVTAPLSGLIPGALYHVRLVATNSAGTTFGADQTFTTAAAPAPPAPVLGQSEDAQPVSGTVFIRLASGEFVRLTGAQQIPSGAVIDARRGTLKLTTATGGGSGAARDAAGKGKKPRTQTQSGTFGGAIFKVTQARAGATKGLVTLNLLEGAVKGGPSFATCKTHQAGDPSAAAASSKVLQLLHASAHGRFRTKGRYSAATVRGTIWTVADRCDGTLTHDVTDSVVVNDFVRHKTIILHAGQSYLAKAPK